MSVSVLPGPKMVFIQGGTFQMGQRRGDIVTVVDFWMDETPVTVAQYLEVLHQKVVKAPFYGISLDFYLVRWAINANVDADLASSSSRNRKRHRLRLFWPHDI